MQITLNGQQKEFSGSPNLENIVDEVCKDKNPVIAEVNGEIIKNLEWNATPIKDGDQIELVSFVGGGA